MSKQQVDEYRSVFSSRYGTDVMRKLWSDRWTRCQWRRLWLEILQEQYNQDAVALNDAQRAAIAVALEGAHNYDDIDWLAAGIEEAETHHDLVAELNVYSRSFETPLPLHLGCTSSDIEDMADQLRLGLASDFLRDQLDECVAVLAGFVREQAAMVCLGRTHLRPAEPTTLGYRFAVDLHELLQATVSFVATSHEDVDRGVAGAVGTRSNLALLGIKEGWLFGNEAPVGQTGGRFWELALSQGLARIAAILYRSAFNFRLLQSEGLLFEGKAGGQVGSSAMPGKSNPITAERVCSLARTIPDYARQVWEYSAHSLLERTLDDSAARRIVLPELFLSMSQIIADYVSLIKGVKVGTAFLEAEVWQYWKAWVPAKALVVLTQRGMSREDAYGLVGRSLGEHDILGPYLKAVFGTQVPRPDGWKPWMLEDVSWLGLEWAIQSAKDTADRADRCVESDMGQP